MLRTARFEIAAAGLLTGLLWIAACQPSPPPTASVEPGLTQKEEAPAKQQGEPEAQAKQVEPAPESGQAPPRMPEETRPASARNAALLNPSEAHFTAPERFTVVLDTTKGLVDIDVRRSWAPIGADRLYTLVKIGYFDNTAFFRVISGFMAQIGIHGEPEVNRAWRAMRIDDDPVTQSNTRGMVSFATSGRNSRVNQFFINFGDNARLDAMGFAPVGRVRSMDVVDQLYSGYGEGAPAGGGPLQARLQNEGNGYLKAEFPELDYIRRAYIGEEVTVPEHRLQR